MNPAPTFALLLVLAGAAAGPLPAQDAPHLTGAVEIGPSSGRFDGDVCVSRFEPGDSVRFLLNQGLNLRHVRSTAGEPLGYTGFHGGTIRGEGLQYTLTSPLPEDGTFCVSYTGGFPVYDVAAGEYAQRDWKGRIAFNGRTVRAAEQAKWFPVLYRGEGEPLGDAVTYELRVRCEECRGIYLSGSAPVAGTELAGSSASVVDPLLFAGDYDFRRMEGSWFLNSGIAGPEAAVLSARIGDIRGYLERATGLPYGEEVVLVEHQSVQRYGPNQSWGFVAWPAIAFAGVRLENFVQGETLSQPGTWRFLAHEMAHYYFGTVLPSAGPWAQFYLESPAEYLGGRVVREFVGGEAFREVVAEWARDAAAGEPLTPLDRITAATPMGDRYRYRYGPLLWLGLEREIGVERMREVLHTVLTAPLSQPRDYRFLGAAVIATAGEEPWRRFEQRCVRADSPASCVE